MDSTWRQIKDNPGLLSRYLVREQVVDVIREFFKSRGFREVFTPTLVPVPSAEANLEVFSTRLTTSRGKSRRAFLIMSPEYSIKKLLAGGIGSCFEICHCFRNREEVSRLHNPEFTMLEWYRTGADYRTVMTDMESLFCEIITRVRPGSDPAKFSYQGKIYDLTSPWPRLSVREAFKKYCQIPVDVLLSPKLLLAAAGQKGYTVGKDTTWEEVFYQLFFNEIEPRLADSGRPTFIYDYPLRQAALARPNSADPRFAERFEAFLAGIELGNCFSELTDWQEQEARLKTELGLRRRAGKTKFPPDMELTAALRSGLPQVAGIAVGVDRLVMLAADVSSVSQTLFFPAGEIFDL